jgi:hypothetical protein
MHYLKAIIATALQRRLAVASLRIALVVGVILNLINQSGAIWGDTPFSIWHFVLNFMVPFCVSSYSAARNELSLAQTSGFVAEEPPSNGRTPVYRSKTFIAKEEYPRKKQRGKETGE